MLGDLFAFLRSVVSHWQALVTGSLVTALVFLLERYRDVPVPRRTVLVVFVWVYLFVAVFLAWRAEHSTVARLGRELAQMQQAPPLPPDYITLHKPWLDPALVISEYRDESFRLAYEIANVGKLPAEEMRLMFVSSEMRKLDKSIRSPRSIAPGASITYEPNPLRFGTKYLAPVSHFTLAVDYYSTVAGARRSFRSVFDVSLRREEIKEGRLKPSAVLNAEGQFTDQDISTFLGFWAPFGR